VTFRASIEHHLLLTKGTSYSGISGPRDQAVLLLHRTKEPRASIFESHLPGIVPAMTSRNAHTTSRFSVPSSAGPLLPLMTS